MKCNTELEWVKAASMNAPLLHYQNRIMVMFLLQAMCLVCSLMQHSKEKKITGQLNQMIYQEMFSSLLFKTSFGNNGDKKIA